MNLDLDLLVAVLATPVAILMLWNWWRFRTGRQRPKAGEKPVYTLLAGFAFALVAFFNWLEVLNIV